MSEFTLPAGPYAAHLMAAHAVVQHLAAMTGAPTSAAPAVEAHANHVREVARWTATAHDVPPRPTVDLADVEQALGGAPDGWEAVVLDDDGLVLAGWYHGHFVTYAPTERIVRVCITALQHAYTHQETP